VNLQIPKIFEPMYKSKKRYKGLSGGRGSSKSWTIADYILVKSVQDPNLSTVCLREVQLSIKHSSKKLLEDRINTLGLNAHFEILSNEIRSKLGTGQIIFKGLRDYTADSIKSLEGFSLAWVEEAQTITKHSLELLTPTIRAEGSEILFSWNPKSEDDAVEEIFRDNPNSILIKANYTDNKFCPTSIKEEAEEMARKDYENYLHIYMGEYKTRSDSQVYKDKFSVEAFETPHDVDRYFGLDFGFSVDPTAGVSCYIKDKCLYIDRESGGVGIEINDTYLVVDEIIDRKNDLIYGDSARPETISFIKKQGYNIVGVKKWAGSIEDGISYIRGFEHIYIHPRCKNTAKEFVKYSYKVDRAGNVTSKLVDKHNHYMDGLRYSLGGLIQSSKKVTSWDY